MEDQKAEWARCRPLIESALEYADGTHTFQDIEDGVAIGRYQFWSTPKSALVTEIIEYPRLKAMNYFLIAGDLVDLVENVEPRLTAWAKAQGCSRVIGVGRLGMERAFKKNGFKRKWVCICKEI